MDFTRLKDGEEPDKAVIYSTSIRDSSFSKPLLPPSSSLLPAGRGGAPAGGGGARNGSAGSDPSSGSVRLASPDPSLDTGDDGSNPRAMAMNASEPPEVRYRECLRNHAASLGGHVLDGCCEFMPTAVDAMKCAACGCHRSFHRREGESDLFSYRQHNLYGSNHSSGRVTAGGKISLLPPPHPVPQQQHIHSFQAGPSDALQVFGNNSGGTTTDSSSGELGLVPTGGTGSFHRPFSAPSSSKKRIRTKFTAEQKVRMMEFAERIGWRIQRQDEAEMDRFCAEVCVTRQVFKVWMHNNKHSIRKQQQKPQEQQQEQQP